MSVPHHLSFLQAGCPFCRPTNNVKALKAITAEPNVTYFGIQNHAEISTQVVTNVSITLEKELKKDGKQMITLHINKKDRHMQKTHSMSQTINNILYSVTCRTRSSI